MKIEVSVIVPIYQVVGYLDKCMDSILNQSFQNMELILIDDGSTDGSSELCDEYARRDARVKVIHKQNGGLSSARNAGLDIARGEYIAFVDSDDWVSPDFIQVMHEVCEKYGCDICQCGMFDVISDECHTEDRGGIPVIFSPAEFIYAEYTLFSWDCVVSWNKLYRRSLFQDIRFPEGKQHEDEFTTWKLVGRSGRLAVLPTRLYYYRRRPDSIVGKRYSYKRLDAGEAYREREEFYREHGCTDLEQLTKARHLQWIDGQIKQFGTLEKRDTVIEKGIIGERQGLCQDMDGLDLLRRDFLRNQYVFPFDLIDKKSSIVLYGGGMVGQQYFLQVRATNYCNIRLWADRDYMRLRKIGIPVAAVDKINEVGSECDYFVIAIVNREIAARVMEMLTGEYHVDRGKIIYCLNSVMNISLYDNRIT